MDLAIKYLTDKDNDLANIVTTYGPPVYWSRKPGFSTLVHIILEQQVSLASAQATFDRLRAKMNPLTPQNFLILADDELKKIGFSRQKIRYCQEVARSILNSDLPLQEFDHMPDDEIYLRLLAINGIGQWTADIYLLIALERPDIWPSSDLALIKALKKIKKIPAESSHFLRQRYTDNWRPWRSVAARILWHYYLSWTNLNYPKGAKKMNRFIFFFTVILLLISTLSVGAQDSEIYVPLNFQKAYSNKTRSADGAPGSSYWQNKANYKINVNLDPNSRLLSAEESIIYFNNSPDTLDRLLIHLFPNVYKKGQFREFIIDPVDAGDGVILHSCAINGSNIDISSANQSITYLHNDLQILLTKPINPADSVRIDISWQYTINANSHMRTGQVDSTSFFIAYFFPRIAVYDDIDGWNNFRYDGIAEFYNDFCDFDVTIVVPQHFVVWATGLLKNAGQVLTDKYAQRYRAALNSDHIIHIIDSTEIYARNITMANESNRWNFKAENVTDFAFATSDHYLWDASSLTVDQTNGRRVLIEAAYDRNSKDFYHVAGIARQTIDYLSNHFPGIPFPFPNETVFNGRDEMEYPMMVNDMSVDDRSYLIKLTSHEISHSYFPFYMGINEAKYAWMDEGWASFVDYHICSVLDSPEKARIYHMSTYIANMGHDLDMPMISISKYLKRPVYHFNSYAKPACFLFVLQDLLGEDLFKSCFQTFMHEWHGKHPTPYDFFYCINRTSKQNLTWLYKAWFFEFGTIDLAINNVEKENDKYFITIENVGAYPVPIFLNVIEKDGTKKLIRRNAATWKNNNQIQIIEIDSQQDIHQFILSHPVIPDATPANNKYVID